MPPSPLRVSVASLQRDPLTVLEKLAVTARPLGTLACLVGRQRVVLVTDPSLVRELLVERSTAFGKQNVIDPRGRPLDARAAETPAEHAAGRRIIQPAVTSERIDAMGALSARLVAREADGWRDAETVDLGLLARSVAARVASEIAVGRALDVKDVVEDFLASFSLVATRLPLRASIRAVRRARRGVSAYTELCSAVAEAGSSDVAPQSVLGLMLAAGRPREEAEQKAFGVLLAGIPTSASLLQWALVLLATEPSLRAGIAAGDVDARGIVGEALRLYPPSWYIARRALEPAGLGAERFAVGDIALVSPYLQHRDPAVFPDPLRVDPGRFATGDPDGFIPFGLGPRRCLGERLAWAESLACVRTLASRFSFRLPAGVTIRPEASATLRPAGGLRLTVATI